MLAYNSEHNIILKIWGSIARVDHPFMTSTNEIAWHRVNTYIFKDGGDMSQNSYVVSNINRHIQNKMNKIIYSSIRN